MKPKMLGKCPTCNANAKIRLGKFPDGYKSKAFCPWCGRESDWCDNYTEAVTDFYRKRNDEED